MKEKLCTRQIVHCLQRFDLSQLVQDLSSINLNDPWNSSHFLGFPLDTGVFFCLTNFQRKKRAKRCPACPIPTQPVGGTVQKSHARDDHKVHHQRYSLNLTSLKTPLGSAFADGWRDYFLNKEKKGPTGPTPVGIQDENISCIDYMHKNMTAKKDLAYILLSTDLLSQMLTMLTTYE